MKRVIAIFAFLLFSAVSVNAQNYLAYLDKKTSAGTSQADGVSPLTDFTVVINQNKPHLYWETGSSSDYSFFEVQRSEDGVQFKTIALFFAKEDAHPHELYNYKDASAVPNGKSVFYRLKVVNAKKEFSFSEPRKVQNEVKNAGVRVGPNPFSDDLTIDFIAAQDGVCTIKLFNAAGSLLGQGSQEVEKEGDVSMDLPFAANLSKGIYNMEIDVNGVILHQQKVVKN